MDECVLHLILLSFIVIGVWKSNVTAIVRLVVVLKKMVKTVAKYVKRITLTSFFLSSFLPTLFFGRMELFHQMLMRYCTHVWSALEAYLLFM